jgi:hypothetical protein
MPTLVNFTIPVFGQTLNVMGYEYTGYDPNVSVPCLIVFPGAGEIGTNASLMLNAGPFSSLKSGVDLGYKILVFEVQNQNQNPRPAEIQAYITALKALYKISAIVLSGYSRGAQDVCWFIGNAESEMAEIAGVFEVSSEGPVADEPGIPGAWEPAWFVQSGCQWWGVCGDQDSFYNSNQYSMLPRFNALKAVAPNQAQFTVLPGVGHSSASWGPAYTPGKLLNAAGQDVYAWTASFAPAIVVTPPPVVVPPPPVVVAPAAGLQLVNATTAQLALVKPLAGLTYYNSTTGKITVGNGTAWT